MSEFHAGLLIGIALGAMWWDYLKGRFAKPKASDCDRILGKLMVKHRHARKWMGDDMEMKTSIRIIANGNRYEVSLTEAEQD